MPHAASSLRLSRQHLDEIVAHCLASYPDEGCGLLVGEPAADAGGTARTVRCHPTANAAASATRYVVDPRDHLRIDRAAEVDGLEVIGVFHSHTHTDAYPSPTDVADAPDPGWHYVLVSLRQDVAALRSYRIEGGAISEEAVVLEGDGR